jgi:hypothetical protein
MRLSYYGDIISPNITKTPEGYLICKNVPIGRTGEMKYLKRELGAEGNPGDMVNVTRDESVIFDPAALASFEGKPVTSGHPPEDIEPGNWANYTRGHIQNVRRGTDGDSDKIIADLFITDPILINEIENKQKREVSCGYACDYFANDDGTYSQSCIRGNHVAVVDEGRAGKSVCIKDSVQTLSKQTERRIKTMSKHESRLKSVLSLFAGSVRDAKTTDEIEEATENATEAIDCMAKDEAAAPAAANAGGEKAEETADGASVSPALLEAIKGIVKEAIAEASKTTDNAPPPPKSEEKAEDGDGNEIAELLAELTGKKSDGETVGDGDAAEQEEALTVEAETMDDGEMEEVTRDAAIAILKNARPAIAAIKNSVERKRVTDALVKSIREKVDDPMASIMKSTAGAAKKKARDSKTEGTFDMAAQQAAYDKHNPHIKKEDK